MAKGLEKMDIWFSSIDRALLGSMSLLNSHHPLQTDDRCSSTTSSFFFFRDVVYNNRPSSFFQTERLSKMEDYYPPLSFRLHIKRVASFYVLLCLFRKTART